MVKLVGKKQGFGESKGKIGIIIILLTGTLTLCACDTDKQQMTTTAVETESMTNSKPAEERMEDSTYDKDEKVKPEQKQAAQTIDAMESPAISILNIQSLRDTVITSEEKQSGQQPRAESLSEAKSVPRDKSVAEDKSVSENKNISEDKSVSENKTALQDITVSEDKAASQENTPVTDINPTVNNSSETTNPNSDVKYSKDDDKETGEAESADIYAQFE